ncbi:MAG: LacI family DNA-binding transcriptional regulator [Anaerolineae bacterium]|jgi:LacI family transcriptional regulator|nr:LacI family DNA-binding transcriptional regulator [Anaerolineae bacterium]
MKPSEKKVTLNDVAEHSGVSYQTVSRVINNHPSVAEDTRQRVLGAIRDLNYHPNRAARSLVTNRSDTIAIISFGTTFYGPGQMVSHITRHAKASGYRVSLSTVEHLGWVEVKSAIDDLHEHLIDGIIMIAPIISDFIQDIRALIGHIPYIQIDTKPHKGVASVVIEQAHGTALAVEHLIGLGHRDIAEISGPLNWYDAIMRHQSWIDTMKRHSLSYHNSIEGNWSAQSGYDGLRMLVKAGAKFTALAVANDQMALGAMAALNELGLRVPDDVSVVGFDNIPESAYFMPALTTVHQDFMALGQHCVEYLVSLINQPDTPVHQQVLYPNLVIRNSTAPVK